MKVTVIRIFYLVNFLRSLLIYDVVLFTVSLDLNKSKKHELKFIYLLLKCWDFKFWKAQIYICYLYSWFTNFLIMIYLRVVIKPYSTFQLIIPSTSKQYMSDKIPYVFRQNTEFLYLTGCQEPDTCVVITTGNCTR